MAFDFQSMESLHVTLLCSAAGVSAMGGVAGVMWVHGDQSEVR